MAPVRFASPGAFDHCRSLVNERLLLSGFQVAHDGKLEKTQRASTLGEAQQRADDLRAELIRHNVHPAVLAFCRNELLERNYFHAVLEASKSVFERLRLLTGLQTDGTALVDASCSLPSGPRVAFNSLATEWERSEQTGLAAILKGFYSTFRTPPAHAPRVSWAVSRSDAIDMLTFASVLHRRLDNATVR
jgi:uncharacterized protein (TIGR02391 family)